MAWSFLEPLPEIKSEISCREYAKVLVLSHNQLVHCFFKFDWENLGELEADNYQGILGGRKMKTMFAQVCAVGNSWVLHASGSYIEFQLLQYTTLSFRLRIDIGTFPLTAQNENTNPSYDTVSFFTLS